MRGWPVPGAYVEDGAGEGADHVVEETAAFDGEDDQGAAAVDVAGEDGADCVFAFIELALEGFEIVGADEVAAGFPHGVDFYFAIKMIDVVAVEDGAVFVGPDEITVALFDGVAGVEGFGDFLHVAYENVVGEAAVDGTAEAFDVQA